MGYSKIIITFETLFIFSLFTLFSFKINTKASPPVLSNPQPNDGEQGISTGNIALGITVDDEDLMNITFRTNASGNWCDIGTNNSQPNGTYTQIYNFDQSDHRYFWSVNCSDGTYWVNQTYSFTTKTELIVSITVNQSSYNFGTKSLNTIYYTNATNQNYFGITNNGNVAVDLKISSTNMTCSYGHTWTLSNSNGPNQFVLDYCYNGITWNHITLTDTTFYTNLDVDESIALNLRLTMPTSINCGHMMECTIRISASST